MIESTRYTSGENWRRRQDGFMLRLTYWPLVVCLCVFAMAAVVKWQASQFPVGASVPEPQLPHPNANAYFNLAAAMLRVPFDQARLAATDRPGLDDRLDIEGALSQAEQDRLYQENLPALRLFERGLTYNYDLRPDYRFDGNSLHNLNALKIARTLAVAGRTCEERGDWDGAMRYYIDLMALGIKAAQGSDPRDYNYIVPFSKYAVTHAARIADHLTADQLAVAAHRIYSVDAAVPPMDTLLQKIEWCDQRSLLNAFREMHWQSKLCRSTPSVAGGFATIYGIHAESARTAYDGLTGFISRSIAIARLQWPQQIRMQEPAETTDPIEQTLGLERNVYLLTYNREWYAATAKRRLVETQLALRAYCLQHGQYPASLAQLVPTCLPSVPIDPFSDGHPLQYRNQGSRYVLLSLGPASDLPSDQTVDSPLVLGENDDVASSGEIVAGVNE